MKLFPKKERNAILFTILYKKNYIHTHTYTCSFRTNYPKVSFNNFLKANSLKPLYPLRKKGLFLLYSFAFSYLPSKHTGHTHNTYPLGTHCFNDTVSQNENKCYICIAITHIHHLKFFIFSFSLSFIFSQS